MVSNPCSYRCCAMKTSTFVIKAIIRARATKVSGGIGLHILMVPPYHSAIALLSALAECVSVTLERRASRLDKDERQMHQKAKRRSTDMPVATAMVRNSLLSSANSLRNRNLFLSVIT